MAILFGCLNVLRNELSTNVLFSKNLTIPNPSLVQGPKKITSNGGFLFVASEVEKLIYSCHMTDWSKISRKKQIMQNYVHEALEKHQLLKIFEQRPAYQQNDYLSWIQRAKRTVTKEKRVQQLVDELKKGDVYMKMAWRKRL